MCTHWAAGSSEDMLETKVCVQSPVSRQTSYHTFCSFFAQFRSQIGKYKLEIGEPRFSAEPRQRSSTIGTSRSSRALQRNQATGGRRLQGTGSSLHSIQTCRAGDNVNPLNAAVMYSSSCLLVYQRLDGADKAASHSNFHVLDLVRHGGTHPSPTSQFCESYVAALFPRFLWCGEQQTSYTARTIIYLCPYLLCSATNASCPGGAH